MAEQVPATKSPSRSPVVQSVDRALSMIQEIARSGADGLSLSDLGEVMGMSRSAVWATLQTLVGRGYVAESGGGYGRSYVLGMELARLGEQALSQVSIRHLAMPVLRSLSDKTGLTSRVAVLMDSGITIVGRVDAPGAVRFNLQFGEPELLHCSAVGKAFLSALPEEEGHRLVEKQGLMRRTPNTITDVHDLLGHLRTTRQRGYSVDDQEDAEGIVCIGAPVFDHRGRPAAAISVTGLKQRIPDWRSDQIGSVVAEHAREISEQIGGIPPC